MRKGDCFFNDAELNAYLDRELEKERQGSLHSHLVICPVCSRRFEVPRYLKTRIHDICLATRAPESLRDTTLRTIRYFR